MQGVSIVGLRDTSRIPSRGPKKKNSPVVGSMAKRSMGPETIGDRLRDTLKKELARWERYMVRGNQ